ncbi:MAG: ABC transporter ATP-binding protein [Pedosphaera sp.]|nr:ABC transporter ATP-binding protein [Pedosphaera sp.]
MFEIENIHVSYGAIRALHGVSLKVDEGSIVTLIGGNGAGKTTTLRAISGMVQPISGSIRFNGRDITGYAPHQVVKLGLAHSPEGRMVFANLTVLENLQMGAYLQRDSSWIAKEMGFVFHMFPRLKEREKQLAGTLSGGEQQMLAIGRALLSRPRFLMLDEPSLGIAPLLIKEIFARLVELNRDRGLPILLVEQNANLALEVSHYGYVLETGRVTLAGTSADLRNNPQVQSAYLGG